VIAAFLSRRIRMALLLGIGAPIAGWALEKVSDGLEARRGVSPVTRGLRGTREMVRRVERPLRGRRR
jgi:hypothetical protein